MKRARLALFLIPAFTILLGCQKDYLEPFHFYLTGTFEGEPLNLDMPTDFTGVQGPTDFQNFTFFDYVTPNGCGSDYYLIEDKSRWENIGSGTVLALQESYQINIRRCVPKSVPRADYADTLYTLGDQPWQEDGISEDGVEIVWWRNGQNTEYYTSRIGGQQNNTFTITRHQAIDGQEFGYITHGVFSCNLYNGQGDTVRFENAAFRIKTATSPGT